MIILSNKSISPHLKLYALSQSPLKDSAEAPLQRLNLLTSTRRFDEIAKAAQNVKEMSFPTLSKKLEKAKEDTANHKSKLEFSRVKEILKQLDAMSKVEDPNFQKMDEGQGNMFELSKVLFEEGNYTESLEILKALQKQELKEQLWLKATWARVYCEIILKQDSGKQLESLKTKIDDIETEELAYNLKHKKNIDSIMKRLYSQKEQFLLLSLFNAFKEAGDEELEKFVDHCTTDKSYFSIVELTCPELLKYVTIALVLNKTIQNYKAFDLFKLADIINRKYVNYSDCFTEYIALLMIEYDFEGATKKLEECKSHIKQDIFLAPYESRIIEGLHFLYFKRACRVYETIELKQIVSFTGMSSDEAELWILAYIRSGDIDAKIDSIAQQIVNNKGKQNPYEKYLDVVPTLGGLVNSLSRAITSK